MNKNLYKILIILLIFFTFSFNSIHASDYADNVGDVVTTKCDKSDPALEADYALLIDATSGTILYSKRCESKVYPASTTKMMTLIIALESGIDMDKEFTISKKAAEVDGSYAGIEKGDIITFKDLLYGMMLPSGNDASYAVGESVSGNIESFVALMNNKAKDLGMSKTHYANTHGMDNLEHYTTSKDMASLALYCMKNETFRTIVSTKTYSANVKGNNPRTLNFTNTNKLLIDGYNGINGIKTGTTGNAGATLIASAERGDTKLISVIMQDTVDARFNDAEKLFNYGFNNYETINLSEVLKSTKRIKVINHIANEQETGELDFILTDVSSAYYTGPKNKIEKIKAQLEPFQVILPTVSAPVSKDEEIGIVTFKYGDETILQAKAIASRSVLAKYTTPKDLISLNVFKDNKISILGHRVSVYTIILYILMLMSIFIIFMLITNSKRKRKLRRRRRSKYVYGRR